jgi:peptidoglycan/LPS O-acetylase OafA/YrhL
MQEVVAASPAPVPAVEETAAGPVVGDRLLGLDGLRGVAIGAVLLGHTVPRLDLAGPFGVELFFVLSGYLITRLLLVERARTGTVSLRDFYARRALRLWPALWVYVAVCAIYAAATGGATGRGTTRGIVPTVTFWSNWAVATGHQLGLMGVTWSLSIEEQFYLVWPALLLALVALGWRPRRIAVALVALAVAVTAWRTLMPGGTPLRLYYGSDVRCDGLALGCAMACWLFAGPLPQRAATAFRVGAATAAVVIVAAVAVPHLGASISPEHRGSLSAPLAALAVAAVTIAPTPVVVRLLEHPLLRQLGILSYSLYLWHFVVYHVVHESGLPSPVKLVVKVALTVVAAYLSRTLVERPFLRLKSRVRGAGA